MIEFTDVHFSYHGTIRALDGVTFTIGEGEIVSLMGENGAGKTTIIRHANGLLKPQRGRVVVDGTDTKNATVAELSRKVGVIFQSPDNMFFLQTVYDEVAFALRKFGYTPKEVEERVSEVLRFFGLERYRDRSPFTLSGGEKKRLSIAIVAAWNPKYLLIDEPTVGQDVTYRRLLVQLLNEFANEGKTIVISTHDVEFVADLRPRVILVSRGRVIADGSARDVLTDEELLKRASLVMPQVPQLLRSIPKSGVNFKLLGVEEGAREIVRLFSRG
ncbi:MAG: energy-coupling factor ABC transporter ATP-binding protein [Aigarchaeota archaeon]|nr:energy-coupling factor ABC transporter ATP-binding protein [Aigarchaeota archaeon]MDW8092433.1 ABC transporter ATP-binding protein [Nitrososphaerota archaeon]